MVILLVHAEIFHIIIEHFDLLVAVDEKSEAHQSQFASSFINLCTKSLGNLSVFANVSCGLQLDYYCHHTIMKISFWQVLFAKYGYTAGCPTLTGLLQSHKKMISSGSVSHTKSKNMCNMSVCSDLTELWLRIEVQILTQIAVHASGLSLASWFEKLRIKMCCKEQFHLGYLCVGWNFM